MRILGDSGPWLHREPGQSIRNSPGGSSNPMQTPKRWNKKGQLGEQEKLKGLFTAVSEKAQGTTKSGLRGRGKVVVMESTEKNK